MPTTPLQPTIAKTPAALPALDLGLIPKPMQVLMAGIYHALNNLLQIVRERLTLGGGAHGERAGHIDAQWLRVTVPSGAAVPVPHGLGRIPFAMFVAPSSVPDATIARHPDYAWTEELIWVLGSGIANLDVVILLV